MLKEAKESQATWIIVAGHYPIVSRGEHGDILELLTYLQPLLEKYDVDAYICGHDHISEHLVLVFYFYIIYYM
jgi:3',5'-cyclic AMP phosphodiesterase CpdA